MSDWIESLKVGDEVVISTGYYGKETIEGQSRLKIADSHNNARSILAQEWARSGKLR